MALKGDVRRLYDTQRWRRIRRHHLAAHPLCEKCEANGLIIPAEEVHHIVPHRGDLVLFFLGKLQSLCKRCHDGITQQKERYGFTNDIGADGWPTDPKHPVYGKKK